MQWKRFSLRLINDKCRLVSRSGHSRVVQEVGKIVRDVAVATAGHSAPLRDVVHPPDLVLPRVDVAPVLPLEQPRGRHQCVEVLPTANLCNKVPLALFRMRYKREVGILGTYQYIP